MSIAKMHFDDMRRIIRRRMDKLLGKVSLVKPIIDKLQIGPITDRITGIYSGN